MSNIPYGNSSLRESFAIQLRVIGALVMRELLTRYGRHNIGFLWLFLEPMLFTVGVTLFWYYRGGGFVGSMIPIVPFAITGYSTVLLWRNAATRCSNAISPNLTLLYHRNVAIIDLFAARVLLEIAGATVAFIILMACAQALGFAKAPVDLLKMLTGWLLMCWFAAALGFVVGALSERSELFQRIWHTLTYLLFPISGAVFMVAWLPVNYREVVLWIPMIHAVEMLRGGYFGDAVRTYYSVGYLVAVNLVLLLAGLLLISKTKNLIGTE